VTTTVNTSSSSAQQAAASAVGERPEIAVGAAFAGGLVLALILKRFAG
jgi:ElaB/YqjD/DUF883 family membrane-anchored ribosome-binding protein